MLLKACVIGANGYGGIELIRLLYSHPKVTIDVLVSHSTQGQAITAQYPQLQNIVELPLEKLDVNEILDRVDVVFFATPSGITKDIAPAFIEAGLPCIDLSGDFRLKDGDVYSEWYKNTPAQQQFLDHAVYGLAELYRGDIQQAAFIANPGCYPTAALLGIIPAIKLGVIDESRTIIIDGKTGVSGAGRKPALGTIFSEINENTKAYKVGTHQHIPEMEQVLSDINNQQVTILFNAHLVPMTRGILCTIYIPINDNLTDTDFTELYKETYRDDYFIRVRPEKTWPATKEVYGTNFCDIGVGFDQRTNTLTVVSVIDNLVKGAAGQAVQNLNLVNHWDEKLGLDTIPTYP
ncbi:N-acetyl-gamma-glutamyl-phosphate reductase [Lentibacillus cibarius]|uniref:N-acetyl-gamma-glutamyl-phosphate reductase n=1 Tax=Lentibacillus cibarius TaxID=2583219 RepID=A0A5S3R853_9BACI|nr:N-acetyl-gamma-glutamyl-phosphate reductase [Lentibacillus cibarius]TMN23733.1 N-acetyl-gamma-glutamyl-phosphate reductase [Lentibacillus cibarius]